MPAGLPPLYETHDTVLWFYCANVLVWSEFMPVRIITDSGSEYRPTDHPALQVLPLTVAFGGETFREGEDLSRERFYELLTERPEHPTTGQVTPFVFGEAIARALEAGDDVVVITMSSVLSGTY